MKGISNAPKCVFFWGEFIVQDFRVLILGGGWFWHLAPYFKLDTCIRVVYIKAHRSNTDTKKSCVMTRLDYVLKIIIKHHSRFHCSHNGEGVCDHLRVRWSSIWLLYSNVIFKTWNDTMYNYNCKLDEIVADLIQWTNLYLLLEMPTNSNR